MADTVQSASSVYPQLPGDSSYDPNLRGGYEDASQPPQGPLPPPTPEQHAYQEQYVDSPSTSAPPSATKQKSGEPKPRLRKACDSCSVRKVKCDETGPPCKSCAALDIPCTFNRPSRRRGPPNRHAEAIKRRRLDDGSYSQTYSQSAASPTRDAAYGLAALAAPVPLSAETICDLPTLNILIDDYFTYIHPLIPIPHEPTFRDQFARREDMRDQSFLALLAGMIETLVSSFPRRPRQLFTSPTAKAMFPNASSLISRCHYVFNEARGKGFLDREDHNLYDACASYFAAISAAYIFDLRRCRLYLSECVMVLRILGFHKPEERLQQGSGPSIGDLTMEPDRVDQQIGRRVFWLCFVGSMSVRQLGSSDSDIIMPHAHSEGLPPLAVEVDDEYITSERIYDQPAGQLSVMVGFNYNVKIYRAFHVLTAIEMAVGFDTLFDWDRQRRSIRESLNSVKAITKDAPPELRLDKRHDFGEWPPRLSDISHYSHLLNGRRDPTVDQVGLMPANDPRRTTEYPKRTVQFEIQKANIYATQLATRSYLVERFWNLYDLHEKQVGSVNPGMPKEERGQAYGSPTIAFVATGLESRFHSRTGGIPSDSSGMDQGEQLMAVEREDIIRDLALLLQSINQVNMEPNGHSFCSKIRQIASTLLSQDRSLMSRMPTLDNESVQEYLRGFIDILGKLERIGSTMMRGGDPSYSQSMNSNIGPDGVGFNGVQQGQYQSGPLSGLGQYAARSQEEIEEEELIQWASLKEHQERFVMKHQGYLGSL